MTSRDETLGGSLEKWLKTFLVITKVVIWNSFNSEISSVENMAKDFPKIYQLWKKGI